MNGSGIKKKLFLILAAIFVNSAFSQAPSVKADDSFYEDAQAWENLGLVSSLPNLRPYPLHLIETILEQAISSGDDVVAKTAQEYYENIFGRPFHGYVGATGAAVVAKIADDNAKDETKTTKNVLAEVYVKGSLQLTDLISYAYDVGISARKNPIFSPFASVLEKDTIFDPAEFGPLDAYIDTNMGIGLGRDNLYLTAGLSRSGYGPFLRKGLALNDSAYHQANIAFAFIKPKWNYVHQISAIGATDMTGKIESLSHSKFASLHAIEVKPVPKLAISYYETMIWGRRFDFTYSLPILFAMGQNVSGASDNCQMGLLTQFRAFEGFNWATDIFIDDFDVNALGKGKLDSKYRFGVQTGVIYSPKDSILTKISGDYTIQSPYLYAHWDYEGVKESEKQYTADTINYQNCMNAGYPLGSALPPNSDRISVSATLKPVKRLKVDLTANYMRHANVCEGYKDEEAKWYMSDKAEGLPTDGSENSTQMYDGDKKIDSAWHKLSFLTQKHKMQVFQFDVKAEYKIPLTKIFAVSFKGGYTFEYIKNAGVDSDIWVRKNATVEDARKAWEKALHDEIKNYFSASVKFEW